jgi:phospholipase/lecithinase/hemolysin
MGNSARFRPSPVDGLEERMVLNSSSFLPTSVFQNLASAFGFSSSSSSKAAAIPMAVLGDSLTDEYRFQDPDQMHARNWVELLNATRRSQITFGGFTTSDRGAPRHQGFTFDWAQSDATTGDMLQSQVPGVLPAVKSGQVRVVAILIGADDFLNVLRSVQNGTLAPAQAARMMPQVAQTASANLTNAVNQILGANSHVRIAVATIPSLTLLPAVQRGLSASPQLQALAGAANQAVQSYNASITSMAAGNKRLAVVNLASATQQLLGSSPSSITVGRTSINVTTPGDDYNDLFLADGIHLGTVGQGLIANEFVNTIDASFGMKIPQVSPEQIVRFARQVAKQTQRGSGPP